MPHWLLKSAAQRIISWLPASHAWNALFQKYVTKSLNLSSDRFDLRLEHCRLHLDHFLGFQKGLAEDFSVLELGTGWFPVVPLGLYLCGAERVFTFDIAPLLSSSRLKETLTRFEDYERTGALQKFLPRLRTERFAHLRQISAQAEQASPIALLERLNIHVRVQDAQKTGLKHASVDLFVSSGVLEYIPRVVLKNILAEFKRVGTARTVHSHYLNLVDQYSYFDRSITAFNFLRFSARQWAYYNSPLTWLNRLRISDYRGLFEEAGFEITKEKNTLGEKEDLQKVPLAPEFQNYRAEDLLVILSWLVARPKSTTGNPTRATA